jgi:LmbE family N-acetylglucosaminyl deacetylase
MNEKKSAFLAIFAHPDDESFTISGTLTELAHRGHSIGLVCATRGEEGEISDPSLASRETLGTVREKELRRAAEVMGVEKVLFLDYRDSGMDGTAANGNPEAFMNAPSTEVVEKLVRIIRAWQPAGIITFEPQGGYGHPDHKAIHNHTIAALYAAATPAYLRDEREPWQVPRLFHTGMGSDFFHRLRDLLEEAGEDTGEFDEQFSDPLWPGSQPVLVRDIGATVDTKWDAIMAHETQLGEEHLFRRLPAEKIKSLLQREFLVQAWPPLPKGATPEEIGARAG